MPQATGTFSYSPTGQGNLNGGGLWNSRSMAPAYFQVVFNPAITFVEVALTVEQQPNGPTRHQIVVTKSDGQQILVDDHHESTLESEIIVVAPAQPIANVTMLTVNTITSPSWVAWRNVIITKQ